ncbi:MAG: hypothetical protein UW24_C0012G0044 [Parcubacteria group bacterium GW2011_GWA2_44_12]|nr:MAG: hypothetical protein UW24_C0012G0044 [Parcubacteria group bacterium GW2011_GWA2_44_12]
MLKKIFKIVFVFALFLPHTAGGQQNLPDPSGYVNDFAGILTNRASLEQEIAQFEAETSNQIAVVTVNSLEGDTIENYAVRLFETWRIGEKNKDNGILLLIAPNEREVRIEVGYGLEGALTDITASAIIRNEILPQFKANNYSAGVRAGVEAIMGAVKGEYIGNSTQSQSATTQAVKTLIPFVFWIIIILIVLLASKGNRNGFLWLLIGMMLGDRGPRGRGGSSGGFGGFGGGSSGGGGASGKW